MKTLEDWEKSELSLNEFLHIKEQVDTVMVDYFINVLPPRTLDRNIVQVGEPHSCDKYGRFPPTYPIFHRSDDTTWRYMGNCFAHELDDITSTPYNPWSKS